jgi:CubicO group peptidase (beta-lactamase class C family)
MIDLADLCVAHGIVGAVAGASVAGERSVTAWGSANADTGLAMTRDTRLMAGSVTKAMTASMVAMLVHQGRLALDAPVVEFLPHFRVADARATETITVRHLLAHTSGFDGDLWPDLGDGDNAIDRMVRRVADAPQLFAPGTGFSYNNAAYAVLGALVEAVHGTPFETALRDLIAEPCGAGLTTDVRRVLSGRFAVGHTTGEDGPSVIADVIGPACLSPAGSRTWATVDDLLAFGELHLGRHGDASGHEALVAMREPQLRVGDPNNGGTMALGVFLDERWGTPVVFHDGGVLGQAAYLRVLPERDTVIVVMATGGVPQVFHRKAIARMAQQLGLTAPGAAVVDPALVIDPSRYVGTYACTSTLVEVREGDDGLTVDIMWGRSTDAPITTGPLPLRPADAQVFLAPLAGRDFVLVFPEGPAPCDHVLSGLRRLPRTGT